jgi:parallel beta-helix repeat protein
MHKKILLCIGITILFLGVGIQPAIAIMQNYSIQIFNGNTLYVGGTGEGNYTKIQDAINDANNGDTIFVFDDNSPYKGYIHVDKSVNIIGENKYTTVVYHNDYYCFSFDVDRINISGFTMENTNHCDYGIRVRETNNHSISENILIGLENGIALSDSENNSILNNVIMDGWSGIDVDRSFNNEIGNNQFLDNECGIKFRVYSKYNTIFDNIFENNGIAVWDYSYPNIFNGNSFNDKPLIYLENKHDKIFDGITAGQVVLINCVNITIQNLVITNSTYGIELINSDNCLVINNTIESNKYTGILLIEDSDSNSIINNNVNLNLYCGISIYGDYIEKSEDNDIIGNNVISNGVNGIYILESTFNNISENIVINNGFYPYYTTVKAGIKLLIRADYNKISKNIVQDNYYGISLWYCSDNQLLNNLIRNSSKYGVNIDESKRNTVDANNFIDNKKDVNFLRYPNSKNYWRGNYWDNWIGFGPKLIFGQKMIRIGVDRWGEPMYFPIPWINFDWRPAKEPFDI